MILSELLIHQFVLIEESKLEIASGMTAFTGETGAGKSILVSALGAIFGARANSQWVRSGASRAEVSAILTGVDGEIQTWLEDQDIEASDELILRRVIHADGRSRAYINGILASLKMLQHIGHICLDLHGQHEHQTVLQPDIQRQLLDARVSHTLLHHVQTAFAAWQEADAASMRLHDEYETNTQQATWMREELERLRSLELEPNIDTILHERIESGRHFAQIQAATATTLSTLEEDHSGTASSVRQLLAQCSHALEPVADFHADIRQSLQWLENMDALLSEIEPTLRPLTEESFDADMLAADESRLMALHDAMRRHDTDIAGLIKKEAELDARISGMDTAIWDQEACQKQLDECKNTFIQCAGELTKARKRAATDLANTLRPLLDKLALEGMQLDIQTNALDTWHSHGVDAVCFMASSNPGEPYRPLAAIASGGEMSRFVLALKACGAMVGMPKVAVFDEVDTGIGGQTAWCVGELLAEMATDRQVLVVSHLPQVAACASHQIHIRKDTSDGRTISRLQTLCADEREHELARMLGGCNDDSLHHARQMLKRGQHT